MSDFTIETQLIDEVSLANKSKADVYTIVIEKTGAGLVVYMPKQDSDTVSNNIYIDVFDGKLKTYIYGSYGAGSELKITHSMPNEIKHDGNIKVETVDTSNTDEPVVIEILKLKPETRGV